MARGFGECVAETRVEGDALERRLAALPCVGRIARLCDEVALDVEEDAVVVSFGLSESTTQQPATLKIPRGSAEMNRKVQRWTVTVCVCVCFEPNAPRPTSTHLAKFDKVLACHRGLVDFKVDAYIAQRRLQKHRHAFYGFVCPSQGCYGSSVARSSCTGAWISREGH